MKKVCIVTGTRAEYGLLYWLMKEIELDRELQLQVIVTGMHLSPEFGLTYKTIEKEFKIDKKIEMLLSSDTSIGITKSMGLAQISFSEAYEELKPDILIVLGDRYEIFSAVSAAMIARIPIAHISGGETTEGAFDESIRHSITKMSHIHFTGTEVYKNRVIQLGEHPNRVFNVGGMGIENIKRLKLLNKEDFEKSIDFKLNKKNILVTFHPVTLENSTAKEQFQELLDAIDELENTNIIFTKANSDTDGRVINQMIDEYVNKNSHKSVGFTSLGQLRYLSALQFVDAMVGNSSSGLAEAPSFKIGTINIGDRQKGRIRAHSVIDSAPNKASIKKGFEKLYLKDFQEKLKTVKNPYGDGCASTRIIEEIKKIDLENLLKKSFYDLKELIMNNIEHIKLSVDNTIIEALKIIDKGALQIGLVVNEHNQLIGTLTDGDIRRSLINNYKLNDKIKDIIFKTPTFAFKNDNVEDIINKALEKKLHQIPILNENKEIIDLVVIDELIKNKIKSNKVILMVGGLGTRLRPLTENTPKPMLKVGDKPILETIVREFIKSGFKNFVFCVNYKSEIIKEYFGDGSKLGINIEYIYEDKRMGTAGALSLLKEKPSLPFFVMNGDLLTNINFANLMDYHKSNSSIATMGVRKFDIQVPYGVVNTIGRDIKTIEEKPTLDFFVSGGIYVLDPKCLEYIPDNEFYDMPTLFEDIIKQKEKSITYPINNYWLDIGNPDDFKKANKEYYEVFNNE